MQNIKDTIANSQLEVKTLTPIGYRTIAGVKHLKADDRINEVKDMGLITDDKFKPYFYKKYYALGDGTFMDLATRAMQGRNPSGLFCSLLGKS